MSRARGWEEYLARLCLDEWSLDPASTVQILKRIDSLVAPGALSDDSVATVLQRSGVSRLAADIVAPSLCLAIGA